MGCGRLWSHCTRGLSKGDVINGNVTGVARSNYPFYYYMVSLSTGDGDLGAVPRVTLVATQAPHGRVSNSSRDDDIECPCGSAVHVIPEV